MKPFGRLTSAAVLATIVSSAYAGESNDEKILQLQKMLEAQQKVMQEQQWQMQSMAEELKALQQSRADDKGKSEGNPVMAAFKDGLVFEDGGGNWKLAINGRIQADYRFDGNDEWSPSYNTTDHNGSWDSFSIRRARLGGTFTFLKDFSVRVEGEYANESIGNKATTAMTYGYLDFNHWKGAKIRAGQFKPFFGLERAESTNFTDFTELSLATANGPIFTSTYDRGVMVFGDPLPWLNYNGYYTNGSAQNNDDNNSSKDIGARVNANFAKYADIKNTVIHVGASASDGTIGYTNSSRGTLKAYTEGAGSSNYGKEFFSVSGLSTNDSNPNRTRLGLETALAYGPVKLQAEYIRANLEGKDSSAASYDNDINAWYVDVNWLITGESWSDVYKNGAFARLKPKSNFDDKAGWGAFELGMRYSKFDASDFDSMLANTSETSTRGCTTATKMANAATTQCYSSEADAWTLGLKWILNPNARLVLNYTHTEFDDPIKINGKIDDEEDAGVLRAQFDF